MRKLIVAMAAACVVVGCKGGDQKSTPAPGSAAPATSIPTTAASTPTAAKKPLSELQQATGKAMAEGFAAGDAKKVAALYAETAVMKVAGAPDATGRPAIQKALEEFFGSFKKIKMGETRVFVKDEVVVSEWVMNATHGGEFLGNKATDKPVGWVGASVLRFNDDGSIKEDHVYWNPAVVLSQIGATKEKNRAVPAFPSGAPQVITAKGSNEEEQNVTIIQQINRTWEAKDEASWLTLLSDNAEWDDVTMPESAKGKANVLKYFKTFATAFPDAKLETLASWGMGDWVIEEGTYAGTNTGPLMGAPPTKKAITIHELNIVQLDNDDKIVKAITYGNDLEMTSQLKPADQPAAKK